MQGCEEDSLEISLVSIEQDCGYAFFNIFYCTNKWFCSTIPPRRDNTNVNPSGSKSAGPSGDNQLQQIMQMMVEQQQKANENKAKQQEQMAKKDKELTQVQMQLVEMLGRRPELVLAPNMGPQIVVQNRDHEPNVLFEKFRKKGPKEFTGQEDPLAIDDWLSHTENIFNLFRCMGKQQVHLAASIFTGLADIWWKTLKDGYQNIANDEAWTTFEEQFGEKNVPSHIKRQKAIEFQLLKQEDMTILEYVTKFESNPLCSRTG